MGATKSFCLPYVWSGVMKLEGWDSNHGLLDSTTPPQGLPCSGLSRVSPPPTTARVSRWEATAELDEPVRQDPLRRNTPTVPWKSPSFEGICHRRPDRCLQTRKQILAISQLPLHWHLFIPLSELSELPPTWHLRNEGGNALACSFSCPMSVVLYASCVASGLNCGHEIMPGAHGSWFASLIHGTEKSGAVVLSSVHAPVTGRKWHLVRWPWVEFPVPLQIQ